MKMKNIFVAVLLSMLILPFDSLAGSFSVFPIRIFLDSKNKTETLKIINESDDKVNLLVKAFEWTQDENGKDSYEPTRDLVYFPRVFSIEGKGERMVKLGFQKKFPDIERTFRLFVEEMPNTQKKSGGASLNIVLKMNLPVFVAPAAKAVDKGIIKDIVLSGKALSVTVQNTGNVHHMVKTIKVEGRDSSGEIITFPIKNGWYLLGGKSRTYTFDVPGDKCLKLKELNIEIETSNYTLKDKQSVDAKMCEG